MRQENGLYARDMLPKPVPSVSGLPERKIYKKVTNYNKDGQYTEKLVYKHTENIQKKIDSYRDETDIYTLISRMTEQEKANLTSFVKLDPSQIEYDVKLNGDDSLFWNDYVKAITVDNEPKLAQPETITEPVQQEIKKDVENESQ